jgi:hypothetical protein
MATRRDFAASGRARSGRTEVLPYISTSLPSVAFVAMAMLSMRNGASRPMRLTKRS